MTKQIQLANVENLFGHNGSREVPSKLVAASNFGANRRDIKIHGNSRTSGTATIDGIGNYARYSGSYYFLDIIQPKDDNQDKFLYAIYRDEWAEFLGTKKKITGTLVKTNSEEVLWEHLQTTSPVTANLGANKILTLHSDQEFTLGVVEVIPIPQNFNLKTWVITRQRFEEYAAELKQHSRQLAFGGYLSHAGRSLHGRTADSMPTGDVSVVAKLLMTEVTHWGMDLVSVLEDWLSENKGCLNLCQLNNAEKAGITNWFNKFKTDTDQTNVYCVEACGETGFLSDVIEENNIIEELDLSEIEGFVGIDPKTGEPTKSNKNVLNFFPHKHGTPDYNIGMFADKNGVSYIDPKDKNNNWNSTTKRFCKPVVSNSGYITDTQAEALARQQTGGRLTATQIKEKYKKIGDDAMAYPLFVTPDYAALGYKKFNNQISRSTKYGRHSWSNQSGLWGVNSTQQVDNIKLVTNGITDPESRNEVMPIIQTLSCPGLNLSPGDVCKISSTEVFLHSKNEIGRSTKYFSPIQQGTVNWAKQKQFPTSQFVFSYIYHPITGLDNQARANTTTVGYPKIKGMGMCLQLGGAGSNPRDTQGRYEFGCYCQFIESHKITIPENLEDQEELVFKNGTNYTPFRKGDPSLEKGFFKKLTTTPTRVFSNFEGFEYFPGEVPSKELTLGQFTDFMLNPKSGTINNYKYSTLPPSAQWLLDDYKYYLSKNPGLWETRKRESTSQKWTDKGMRSAKTSNRSGSGPNDPESGDPEYFKASISGHGYNLYLTSQDELTRHTLHFGGGRGAASYADPINNDIWGKLPRTGSRRRGGEYISGDIQTLLQTTPFREEGYYDLLRPMVFGNAAKYISNIPFADNLNADLKKLDYTCKSLYQRFAPELQATETKSGEGSIAGPTKADYQTTPQIFDLVGTKYYMVILQKINGVKPKISLVVKDNTLIGVVNNQKLTLNEPTNHQPNIIDAINQTNVLFLDGHTAQLNTKFSFSNQTDKIVKYDLTLNSFDLPAEGLTEYYSYTFKGPIEFIDNQYSISKKRVATTMAIDEFERLRLDREMYTEQRSINQAILSETRRANTTSINSGYQDYSLQKGEANKAIITGGVFGGAGAVAGGVAVGGAMSAMAAGSVAGPIGAAIGAVVGVASAITGAVEASQKAATESMKTARDLMERETVAAKQQEIQKNQIDHTHKYAEIHMRRELDRASNQYINPVMTDKAILDAYLSLTGKPKYHIIHNIPSPTMLIYIKAFFKEYGADVLAPDFSIHPPIIKNTNQTMIYQFTSVYSTDIKDITLLRNLQIRLVNGIKII